LCVLPQHEYFVSVLLMVFIGSVAGFLYHNLNPARIFMGDAGAMFCGYILATVALLGTFYTESTPTRIAVVAPLLALCVPLFDTASVIYIRWRRGESIMKGDKRHFSHRLVELGMTPRQAVEFIFLVAGVTGLGGALLGQVGIMGTVVIIAQTAGIFLLIILLMRAGKTPERPRIEQAKEEPSSAALRGEVPQRPLH
jgi:UDP-GlcNAc:undecaprenyl-phosphate GlcNAc-1-phosphate transferase